MKKHLLKFSMPVLAACLIFSPLSAQAKTAPRVQQQCLSVSAVKLQGDLRKLWIDHTIWTRSYIVSAVAGLKDQNQVLTRLLKNQKDIGNAIKPYYGEAAGNKLGELLTEHIVLAGKLTASAKTGNQADFKKYNTAWYRNADDIARFLSSANPNWPEKTLKEMLYIHLQFVTDQVASRLKQNWNGDISAFDLGEDHIIKMADTLTGGIIKQFPNKFQ